MRFRLTLVAVGFVSLMPFSGNTKVRPEKWSRFAGQFGGFVKVDSI